MFSPKPGQRKSPALVLAEPVDAEDARRVGYLSAELQPVVEVVGHVVAAERQHRHRVAADRAGRAVGGGGRLGAHRRAQVDAVRPVERLEDERDGVARRPPKMNAVIGTPSGLSHSGSSEGHWLIGAVKRAFGCAALRPESGVHAWPCQSISSRGRLVRHALPPDVAVGRERDVREDRVRAHDAIAFGFDLYDVPGATPKKPASGLIA